MVMQARIGIRVWSAVVSLVFTPLAGAERIALEALESVKEMPYYKSAAGARFRSSKVRPGASGPNSFLEVT